MKSITIVAVGGKHDASLADGIATYGARLRTKLDIIWKLLPHRRGGEAEVRAAESRAIAAELAAGDIVVLLDERGEQYTSPAFAVALQHWQMSGRRLVLVIGGAYGVGETLRERADAVVSLSPMVFPHQLVRLLLVEQLYRAQSILAGHPYHHE